MELRHSEFRLLQALFYQYTGIALADCKKQLVVSRLAKRLRFYHFDTFYQYYNLLKKDPRGKGEVRCFVDQLTTHETSFFREPKHFEFLAGAIGKGFQHGRPLRVWSAACSTGQEPFSIAMTVADTIAHSQWQIVASDISIGVLDKAKARCFCAKDIESVPMQCRLEHCLMGTGDKKHQIKIKKSLAQKISFEHINLTETLPAMESFDFIFLRNVLIYFDEQKKNQIVSRLVNKLKPNGYLMLGHAESLLLHPRLKIVQPTVYQLQE